MPEYPRRRLDVPGQLDRRADRHLARSRSRPSCPSTIARTSTQGQTVEDRGGRAARRAARRARCARSAASPVAADVRRRRHAPFRHRLRRQRRRRARPARRQRRARDCRSGVRRRAARAAGGGLRRRREADGVRAHGGGLRAARGEGARAGPTRVAVDRGPRCDRPKWRSSIPNAAAGGRRAPQPAAPSCSGRRDDRGTRASPAGSRRTCWLPDLGRSLDNLLLHKLRTLLTMLGMIFGVAAVLSMLSIGAGAQQQVMAFIEGLGVRNLIVEARETTEFQAYPENPAAVAGPDVPGPARDPGVGAGHRPGHAAQAVHADAGDAEADRPRCRWSTASSPTTSRSPDCGSTSGRFFTRRRSGARRGGLRARRGGARGACSAAPIRSGASSRSAQQWFRVIGIAGPQAVGAGRRRRPARRRTATT